LTVSTLKLLLQLELEMEAKQEGLSLKPPQRMIVATIILMGWENSLLEAKMDILGSNRTSLDKGLSNTKVISVLLEINIKDSNQPNKLTPLTTETNIHFLRRDLNQDQSIPQKLAVEDIMVQF
jgi:hypothetical protein